jgi:hypothetical protein
VKRSSRSPRRGTVLVYCAMLVFALCGVAALVVDLGFLCVTRQRMQGAADVAALEGLRFRDVPPLDLTDPDRRMAAVLAMGAFFPVPDSDSPNSGAGPTIDMTAGTGDADAMRTITSVGTYVPNPQLNSDNAVYGDLVAGDYQRLPTSPVREQSDYTIPDEFTPAAASRAFLVRLRRTNDRQGLDNQAGISSAGPPLPFLFARGNVLQQDPNSTYSPRQDGLTVRALAIADARPAVSVGMPVAAASIPGLTPFALERTFWQSATVGASQTLLVDGTTGALTVKDDPTGTIVGQLADSLSNPNVVATDPNSKYRPNVVGRAIADVQTTTAVWASYPPAQAMYVPIYQQFDPADRTQWALVVFGNVAFTPSDDGTTITLTVNGVGIAAANVSTSLVGSGIETIPPALFTQVVVSHRALSDAVTSRTPAAMQTEADTMATAVVLLAPTLVR